MTDTDGEEAEGRPHGGTRPTTPCEDHRVLVRRTNSDTLGAAEAAAVAADSDRGGPLRSGNVSTLRTQCGRWRCRGTEAAAAAAGWCVARRPSVLYRYRVSHMVFRDSLMAARHMTSWTTCWNVAACRGRPRANGLHETDPQEVQSDTGARSDHGHSVHDTCCRSHTRVTLDCWLIPVVGLDNGRMVSDPKTLSKSTMADSGKAMND